MSWKGILRRAGIVADGNTITFDATKKLASRLSSSAITGTIRGFNNAVTMTAASSANIVEAFRSSITADVKTGAWANAIVGSIDYSTSGAAHGMAAAICAEMIPPNSSLARGALYALDIVFGCGASSSWGSAGPVAFIHLENWGTKAHFSANAFLFHLAGETAATGGLLSLGSNTIRVRIGTTTKYLMLSTAEDTIAFSGKLAGQLYHNLSDQSYTVLKIHNHDTTAEIGGLETKGDLINASGSVVGVQASWTYEPTGATGAPSGVSACSNVLAVSSGFTVTAGNIYALVGEAQLYGTLNGATVNVAGVIGVVGGNGANTQVLHMAGVQSAMSTGLVNPTTGTLSYFLANSLSTVVVDNLITVLQAQYVTNFASFDAAGAMIFTNVAITAVNTSHALRILIEGVNHYIPVYSDLSWGA